MPKVNNQQPTYANCIFHNRRNVNGCSIIDDKYKCDPATCTWRHTEESYFASLEKAMQNYEKKTGMNDYIDKCVFGVTVKEKFRRYLNNKAS